MNAQYELNMSAKDESHLILFRDPYPHQRRLNMQISVEQEEEEEEKWLPQFWIFFLIRKYILVAFTCQLCLREFQNFTQILFKVAKSE